MGAKTISPYVVRSKNFLRFSNLRVFDLRKMDNNCFCPEFKTLSQKKLWQKMSEGMSPLLSVSAD